MNQSTEKGLMGLGVIALLVIVVVLFIAGPLVLVTALNLLGFAVPYSLKSWFGAFLFSWCVRMSLSVKVKRPA